MGHKKPKPPPGTHFRPFSVRNMREDLIQRMRVQTALRGGTLGEMVNKIVLIGLEQLETTPVPPIGAKS